MVRVLRAEDTMSSDIAALTCLHRTRHSHTVLHCIQRMKYVDLYVGYLVTEVINADLHKRH